MKLHKADIKDNMLYIDGVKVKGLMEYQIYGMANDNPEIVLTIEVDSINKEKERANRGRNRARKGIRGTGEKEL